MMFFFGWMLNDIQHDFAIDGSPSETHEDCLRRLDFIKQIVYLSRTDDRYWVQLCVFISRYKEADRTQQTRNHPGLEFISLLQLLDYQHREEVYEAFNGYLNNQYLLAMVAHGITAPLQLSLAYCLQDLCNLYKRAYLVISGLERNQNLTLVEGYGVYLAK